MTSRSRDYYGALTMGLFDFLKPRSPVERAAKQVKEAFAQPEYRRSAMDKLFEIGTDEAYAALLGRFAYNANGSIADEEEKRDLVAQLVQKGEPVLPSLKRFIASEKQISYPITALIGIMGKEEGTRFLIDTLKAYEPIDHRSTAAKTTLILTLKDLVSPEEAELFVPYLDDHADDVQFQALEALESLKGGEGGQSEEAVVAVMKGNGHATRIQRRAAQLCQTLGWSLKEAYAELNSELKDEYLLDKKGLLVKKTAHAE